MNSENQFNDNDDEQMLYAALERSGSIQSDIEHHEKELNRLFNEPEADYDTMKICIDWIERLKQIQPINV